MPYMSDLLGKPVADLEGNRIGYLDDLVAKIPREAHHPKVVALAVRRAGGPLLVPFSQVAVLVAPAIPLNVRLGEIVPYQPDERDIFLTRDVLDVQLIDTNGMRVVRVNDLELARVNSHFYVANVDVGTWGILRRMGLSRTAERLARLLRKKPKPSLVSWDDVEFIPGSHEIRLKTSGQGFSDLHPADLAEIISDLGRVEGGRFVEALDVKTLADALEEVEPDFQASLVEAMPDEKVADVLEEMSPDEAADLLAELPEERSAELLKLMQADEARDVRKLLAYPVDTAGGIMNTEYVTVRPTMTAAQVIAYLRETAEEDETIFYLYVTDDKNHLVGDFSLQDLVLAQPDTLVSDFMQKRAVSVKVGDSQEDVAQVVAKYNLFAVPVVDNENYLHGIVTADDALDKILPTAWKKRLPRLY
jgi:magnesium transporter